MFLSVFKKCSAMESNKENMYRKKPSTKIPLPLDPLPALPERLVSKSSQIRDGVRSPLRTVHQFNSNIPTSSSSNIHNNNENAKKNKTNSLRINSKHVTIRAKNEFLDWDYQIFKDEDFVISISSDDDVSEDIDKKHENKEKSVLEEPRLDVTPAVNAPKNKTVKNIKRSLKRPHSRELQGISPVANKNRRLDDRGKWRSNFNENLRERLQPPDFCQRSYMKCLTQDYSDEIFEYLLTVEKKPVAVPKPSSITRACIINWLIKVNGPDGNPAIVQSACWYFDSILGVSEVPISKLQLVAAACYWIAQKLHSPIVHAKTLVKCSNYAFTADMLLKTEKNVLQKLKFPVQPVVPQEFITYLSWVCDKVNPGNIEVVATFLYMSGLLVDKALTKEFPSVIAAAAVMNALLILEKHEQISCLQSCPVYKAAEKKTSSMSFVSFLLRRGVRTISDDLYEYKGPLEHYGVPPYCIAQTVIKRTRELSVLDKRHAHRQSSISFMCK